MTMSHNEHKSIAYTAKTLAELERQYKQKILRVIRAHEKRIARMEIYLKIVPSDKEIYNFSEEADDII